MNAETCLYHVRETRAYNITRAQERIRAGESARDERLLIAVMDRILEASNAASPEPVPATNQAGEVAIEQGVAYRIMHVLNVAANYATAEANGGEFSEQHRADLASMNGDIISDDRRILFAALATQPATSQEGEVTITFERQQVDALLGHLCESELTLNLHGEEADAMSAVRNLLAASLVRTKAVATPQESF